MDINFKQNFYKMLSTKPYRLSLMKRERYNPSNDYFECDKSPEMQNGAGKAEQAFSLQYNYLSLKFL